MRIRSGAALAALGLLTMLGGAGCKGHAGEGDAAAKVNGRKILTSDIEKYYRNQTQGKPTPSAEQAQTLRLNILHELIDNEILIQRGEKLGVLATDDEVNGKLNELKAPYTSDEFAQRLKDRGVTEDDLKHDLRRQLTVDKVVAKEITAKINISDSDVTDYYNAHKAEFNLIVPQYHLAQILVTTRPEAQVHNLKNDKAQNEDEAKKKILMLMSHLQGGDDFAKLAMDYSEQPDTAASGGDLGFIPENSLHGDKQAFDAVSHLKPGQYTQPLPAGDPTAHKLMGFRIIKLIATEPAGQRELKDPKVQQAVHDQLRQQREELLKSAYFEAMHDKSKIENYLADQILEGNGV